MTYYSLVCSLAAFLDLLTWLLIAACALLSLASDRDALTLVLALQLAMDLVDNLQYLAILSAELPAYF